MKKKKARSARPKKSLLQRVAKLFRRRKSQKKKSPARKTPPKRKRVSRPISARSSPKRKSKKPAAKITPRRSKKSARPKLSARETRAIKLADKRPMPRVKKRSGHRDLATTAKYKNRSTVEKKRYSQNLSSTIVFKRNVVEYSKGVKRGKINRFYRQQVLGVDAKNFYSAYGKRGRPQKFIGRLAYRAKINGKWEKKYMSVSRFKAKNETEFLKGLKNKYSPFGNPGGTIAKYAQEQHWEDVEVIGMEFEVIL